MSYERSDQLLPPHVLGEREAENYILQYRELIMEIFPEILITMMHYVPAHAEKGLRDFLSRVATNCLVRESIIEQCIHEHLPLMVDRWVPLIQPSTPRPSDRSSAPDPLLRQLVFNKVRKGKDKVTTEARLLHLLSSGEQMQESSLHRVPDIDPFYPHRRYQGRPLSQQPPSTSTAFKPIVLRRQPSASAGRVKLPSVTPSITVSSASTNGPSPPTTQRGPIAVFPSSPVQISRTTSNTSAESQSTTPQ